MEVSDKQHTQVALPQEKKNLAYSEENSGGQGVRAGLDVSDKRKETFCRHGD
jgi:hypothetical protein